MHSQAEVNHLLLDTLRVAVKRYPLVTPLLTGRARWMACAWGARVEVKNYADFLSRVKGLIRGVYSGAIGGSFIDSMAALVSRQISLAYQNAWRDEGIEGEKMPGYLTESAESLILEQYDFVDGFYRDIVDARVDKSPLDGLYSRAEMWAARFNEAYNEAVTQITLANGGKLVWELGATEQHCVTCSELNGKVAFASQWEQSGLKPQSAPNDGLQCQGWHCDCALTPTDARRTKKVMDKLRKIAERRDGAR